ncbi:MAG TPA: DUF4833 domain-containing protein [Thermoanaerobaculaceae bacterium]|nr:DUF4833 domain-containing protein [Thermoanaerobaculaceae bacterium]
MVSISRTIQTAALALALCAAVPTRPAARRRADPNRLFVIQRSLNANVVVYDAVRDKAGGLDRDRPVTAFWLMNADKGERRNLNLIEKAKAYGFDVRPEAGGAAEIRLKAMEQRPIRVQLAGRRPQAVTHIAGQDAVLNLVYIRTKPGSSVHVQYVDLFGFSVRGHRPLRERLTPSA